MKASSVITTLIVATMVLLCVLPTANTIAPSGYAFVKSHVLSGSPDGALSDYQVKLIIHSGTGTDNGQNVYLDGNSLSWPNDIRFTNSNDDLLNFWVESYDANTATVWVKVDSIPASPGSATIKLYYGKAGETSASDGNSTFVFFDDFTGSTYNTSKWVLSGNKGYATVANGELSVGQAGSMASDFKTVNSWGTGYAMRAKMKSKTSLTGSNSYFNPPFQNTGIYVTDKNGMQETFRYNGNSVGSFTYTAQTYSILDAMASGSNLDFYIDGGSHAGITNYAGSPGQLDIYSNRGGGFVVDWVLIKAYTYNEPQHGGWDIVPPVTPPVAGFTANPTSGTAPLTVQFTDQSTGTPTGWQWNFGDGTANSTVQNPIHAYASAGTYDVTLTATNADGSSSIQKNSYITVIVPPPIADFTADATSGIVPLTIQFTDQSTGSPTNWQWNFGDGTQNGTAQNPVHTYASAGIYDVTLTATNSIGSSSILKAGYITVITPPPVADFTANATTGLVPLSVQFTDQSTGMPTGWQWDFGDGSPIANEQNPVHIYSGAGTFSVTLTATSAGGQDTIVKADHITVFPVPAAHFTSNVTSGVAPLTVLFTDTSTGSPTSREWNFGDGSPNATGTGVEHTFTSPGIYNVMLTVTTGSYSDTTTGDITVLASLKYPPAYKNAYGSVVGRVTEANAAGGRDVAGAYVAIVNAYNTSEEYASTTSDASGNYNFMMVNATYSHLDGSGDMNAYKIYAYKEPYGGGFSSSFGADADNTASTTTAVILFPQPARIELVAGRDNVVANGTDSITITAYVYDVVGDLVCDGYGLNFTVGNATDNAWNGGFPWTEDDGSLQASGQRDATNIVITGCTGSTSVDFGWAPGTTAAGDSTIWAYYADNASVCASIPISFIIPIQANFSANVTEGIAPLTVQFTDQSTGNATAWSWDFGDGTPNATVQNPIHTYENTGIYNVSLTVTDANGPDTIQKTGYITVTILPPIANFTANATIGVAPLSVQFTDMSTGAPTGWQWDFGDGTPNGTEQNPIHVYSDAGTFNVTLAVINAGGQNVTTSATYITVLSLPVVNFTSNVTAGYAPLTVQFNDTSVGEPTNWSWEFGDNGASTDKDPVYTYVAPGNYTVNLTIANALGMNATVSVPGCIYVNSTSDRAAIEFDPIDDIYANESVSFTGNVTDLSITSLALIHNDVDMGMIPVTDGRFNASVNLTAVNNVTLVGIDSHSLAQSATLILDGDRLSADYELEIGFDPMDSDSDNALTPENESDIGTLDGNKCLYGDRLPVYSKHILGLNLTRNDTDGDGLTDYFEVTDLGLYTDPLAVDTDGNGIQDDLEDADSDGLNNVGEQSHGTNPLNADTDGDTLTDAAEVAAGTDPLKKDTDNDGLPDDSEPKLGVNPVDPDTNDNGVLDGNETYTYTVYDDNTRTSATITGKGDLTRQLKMSMESSEAFLNNPARVSDVVKFNPNGTIDSAVVTIPYDPALVPNPANISLAYFNRTYGTYIPLASTVYTDSNTVSATVPYLTDVTILDRQVVSNVTSASAIVSDPRVGYSVRMTTGWLQQGTTFYYLNDANFAAGHYILVGQGWYNDYTGIAIAYGPFQNYNFGAGIRVIYGNMNVPISSLNPTNNRVEFDHSGGHIGINHQIPYSPSYCTGDLTYTLYYVNTTDSDGDGLLDYIEDMGFYDGNYNFYRTNSSDPDTDDDGLNDGEEVDVDNFWIVNNFRYYHLYCDPTKNDTDSDSLDDYEEIYDLGTDPCNKDTDNDAWTDGDEVNSVNWPVATYPWDPDCDGDGLIDSIDPDPWDAMNNSMPVEWHASEFVQGLVAGDALSNDPRHQYEAFQTGKFISQFFAVGSFRDLVIGAHEGKKGAEMVELAIGSIPGYGIVGKLGKAPKAIEACAKLATGVEKAKYLAPIIKADKTIDKITAIEHVYGTTAARIATESALSDTAIEKLITRNVEFNNVDYYVKVGTDGTIPTMKAVTDQDGRIIGGVDHYMGRHVTGTMQPMKDGTTLFPSMTPVTWNGKAYPGTSELAQSDWEPVLKGWVDEAIQSRGYTDWPANSWEKIEYEFTAERYGVKKVVVQFNPKTGIGSVYPLTGSQVYKWNNGAWAPTV